MAHDDGIVCPECGCELLAGANECGDGCGDIARRKRRARRIVAARRCIGLARAYRAEGGRGDERAAECLAQAQSYRAANRAEVRA